MSSHKRVPLVEYEAALRRIIARSLFARGHRVVEADNARDALARLNEDKLGLLLLDINLADRSRWDVLHEMRRQSKDAPAFIVSAVHLDPVLLDEFGRCRFPQSPFLLEALLRIVAAERPKESELAP